MRRQIIHLLLAAVALAGCDNWGASWSGAAPSGAAKATERNTDAQAAEPNADPEPSSGGVVATVNGEPIPMAELHELLLHEYGLRMAQQLIADELVRQAAAEKGVTVTPAEVQAEHERTMNQLFAEIGGANDAQRERVLEQFLERRDMSREMWNRTMHRNALLAKLAADRVQIDEQELRRAYGRKYGRQVQVRHIQVASLQDAQEVLRELEQGADFAELAQRRSLNPSSAQGGLLPPIGPGTEGVPQALRQAALSLDAAGEISDPVQAGTTFHILYAERIIPPQDVAFESVRDELERELRRNQRQTLGMQMLAELVREADVEYVNPVLQQQAAEADREPQP